MSLATISTRSHFPVFPTRLLFDFGAFALICWGAAVAGSFALTIGVSLFRPIEVSGWSMAQQIGNWFALAIGAHIGWQQLQLNVTHGQSRRGFLKSAFIFVVVWPAFLALLYALTFYPEALLYRIAGWPQVVTDNRLYDGPFQTLTIFLESWMIYALWAAGGLMLGIAWYRSSLIGSLMIPVALVFGGLAAFTTGNSEGPLGVLFRQGLVPENPELLWAIPMHVACTAGVLAVTWFIGRDVDIRRKVA